MALEGCRVLKTPRMDGGDHKSRVGCLRSRNNICSPEIMFVLCPETLRAEQDLSKTPPYSAE